MRNAFASELYRLALADERIVALSGDIGNHLFDSFKESLPARFFNCGVAEAGMTGLAAGLALCGLRPVTYTIASFNTARCFEQIKLDVAYPNLPVVVVGVGAGLGYAELGPTHQSCEDLALLRTLPTMTVLCPGDPLEAKALLRAALSHPGPVYLRLGKKGEPNVHGSIPDVEIGKGIPLRPGKDVCLLATGTVLPAVAEAAEELERTGVSAQVFSVPTVKPLDEALLSEVFERFSLVATVEEHSLVGGFGSAVAEWLADGPARRARLCRMGVADTYRCPAGGQEHARAFFGLTAPAIAGRVLRVLEGTAR
jgi:transketolase